MKINNLRDDLIKTYEELINGQIGINDAKERANVAGKILASAKTEFEYNKFTGKKHPIPFLEVDYDKDK